MFDLSLCLRLLETEWLGRRFWYFPSVDSTNRYLRDLPAGRLSHGLVCLTDCQKEGRGQYGRRWHSRPGENLTFTMVLTPGRSDCEHLWPLVAIYALNRTLLADYGVESKIKWPNDLIISGKKVAGVLGECRYSGKMTERMLVGMGININQRSFPDDIASDATAVAAHTECRTMVLARFLAGLLNRMEQYFDQAEAGDSRLVRNMGENLQCHGEKAIISVNGIRMDSPVTIMGINENGSLAVHSEQEGMRFCSHGEVRIERTDC